MSRITKEIAANVARQMAEHKLKMYEEADAKMRVMLRILVRSQIPKPVLELYETHHQYFDKTSRVRLHGHGFNCETYTIEEVLPTDHGGYHSPDITPETGKLLWEQYVAIGNAKKEWEQLRDEIEVALLNLKTYKKVQAMLPEAYPYLPQQGTLAIAVNLDGLRSKLNSK